MPALFSDGYFSMKKGVRKSQIHYELSENQIFFCFFIVFLGDLEVLALSTPPPSQATSRSPPLLGLKDIRNLQGLIQYFTI